MSECTHNCDTCTTNCESRGGIQKEKPNDKSSIKKAVAVVSGKGGVGKSSVTAMSAVWARRNGYQTGILDADITGPSMPKMFGLGYKDLISTDEGLHPATSITGIKVMSMNLLMEDETQPVIWRSPVITGAMKQFWTDVAWGEVDYMFVDMPPGTGDVMLTVCQTIPVDALILVTTPQELVEMIVEKALKMANLMEIPVMGLVENMSYLACPDCNKHIELFGKSRVDEIADRYNIPLTAKLPIDSKLTGGVDKGMIELFNGDWLDKISDAIYDMPAKKA